MVVLLYTNEGLMQFLDPLPLIKSIQGFRIVPEEAFLDLQTECFILGLIPLVQIP